MDPIVFVVIFLIAVLIIFFYLLNIGDPSDSSPPSVSPPPRRPSRDSVDPPAPAKSHNQPERRRESPVRVQGVSAREHTAVAEPASSGVRGEGRDLEMILGIRAGMSEGEIRRILLAEYRKWNSRVTNPDPDIRKRAEEMLRLIGGVRQQLLG